MHTTDQPSPQNSPSPKVLLRPAQRRAARRSSLPAQAAPPSAVPRHPQDAATLLRRQRELGNRMVQRMLATRKAAPENTSSQPVANDVEAEIERARGAGQPLDRAARSQMEGALGADLGNVRVHADQRADNLSQALDARAFTTGQDVFFRQGHYAPGSPEGRELLAHELTHVVQQGAAPTTGVQAKLTVGAPDDEYEQEADQVARQVMRKELRGEQESVQRQPEEEDKEQATPWVAATPTVMKQGAGEDDSEQMHL